MAVHSALTGADLHEPKGVASAGAGGVYVANGAGSGVWTLINNSNKVYLTTRLEDISSAKSTFMVAGIAGAISIMYAVIDGAIGTANNVISLKIAGVPVTSGSLTVIQVGSAAGDTYSASPSGANVITNIQPIEILTDGASTNVVNATITLVIQV